MYACIYIYTYTLTKESVLLLFCRWKNRSRLMAGTGAVPRPTALPIPKSAQQTLNLTATLAWVTPTCMTPCDSPPLLTTCLTLCSTRQEVFQELLIQLLLPDPSNNGGRKKSSFVGQAHSFQSVLTLPNMLLLLSDVTKVLNFQGSVSGKLQSAFSTCARRPPFPVQILQSQRHLPTCTCCARLGCLLLIPPGKPLEPSSPLQPWASHVQHQSSPIPQVHFLYGIRHKTMMLNVFRAVQSLEDAMAEA